MTEGACGSSVYHNAIVMYQPRRDRRSRLLTRSRSRKNDNQSFSNTLAPLRYLDCPRKECAQPHLAVTPPPFKKEMGMYPFAFWEKVCLRLRIRRFISRFFCKCINRRCLRNRFFHNGCFSLHRCFRRGHRCFCLSRCRCGCPCLHCKLSL